MEGPFIFAFSNPEAHDHCRFGARTSVAFSDTLATLRHRWRRSAKVASKAAPRLASRADVRMAKANNIRRVSG